MTMMTPKLKQALIFLRSPAGQREITDFIKMHNRNKSRFKALYAVWDWLVYNIEYFWKFKVKPVGKLKSIK